MTRIQRLGQFVRGAFVEMPDWMVILLAGVIAINILNGLVLPLRWIF